MTKTTLRITASLGLALCLGLAFTPLGCGGSNYGGSNAWSTRPGYAREEPPVPPETFAAMTACVTEAKAKARLTDTVYALQFDVEVNEHGKAVLVKLRDASLPKEPGMEACLGDAMVGMTLPLSVLARMPRERVVSPASRGLEGQVWEEFFAAGAAVNLAPILLTATAVTVSVWVGVKATTAAIDYVRRKRKRKEKCLDMYEACRLGPWFCSSVFQGGETLCGTCRWNCDDDVPYASSDCYKCGFRDVP